MNKSNLLTFLTTVTLVFICSSASASSVETKPAVVAEVVAEISSESVVSDSASDSSSVAEPATVDITQEQEPEQVPKNTEATVVEADSDMEYTCKHDNARRIIRVFNDTASGLACEVTYEKTSGTKTLWTAQYDKEFCVQKAAEFASKQVAWGWSCVDKEGVVVSALVETPIVESSIPEVETPAQAETMEAVTSQEQEAAEVAVDAEKTVSDNEI